MLVINEAGYKWVIFFALPNLSIREPFGNEKIAIVPHTDERVQEIISSSVYARALVEGFENQFKTKIYPSLLIVHRDAPAAIRDIDTLVGFRNAFAISSIITGHEHRLTSTVAAYPLYSDYFDFYPITISKDDDCFLTNSPDLLDSNYGANKFRGQPSPRVAVPGPDASPDKDFFDLLQNAWERRFFRRASNVWSAKALFRSLEMAYHASAMPNKNRTIYDYGSSASLWVSALEILSHPRRGKANLMTVIWLLGGYDWNNKAMKKRIYKVNIQGKSENVNLVQRLYKELYDTRNDFLHGNPVRPSRLRPFRNKKARSITLFAPLIYKVALLHFLEKFKDKRRRADWKKKHMSKSFNEQRLSAAILKCKS